MNVALGKSLCTSTGANRVRRLSGEQRVIPRYEVHTQQLLLEMSGKGVSGQLQDAFLRGVMYKL